MSKHSFKPTQATLKALIRNLKKIVGAKTVLTVNGTDYSVPVIVKWCKSKVPYYDAVDADDKKYRSSIKARRKVHPGVHEFLQDLGSALKAGKIGEDNPVLLDLGFEPAKTRRSLTADEKKASADKARATRARKKGDGGKAS